MAPPFGLPVHPFDSTYHDGRANGILRCLARVSPRESKGSSIEACGDKACPALDVGKTTEAAVGAVAALLQAHLRQLPHLLTEIHECLCGMPRPLGRGGMHTLPGG